MKRGVDTLYPIIPMENVTGLNNVLGNWSSEHADVTVSQAVTNNTAALKKIDPSRFVIQNGRDAFSQGFVAFPRFAKYSVPGSLITIEADSTFVFQVPSPYFVTNGELTDEGFLGGLIVSYTGGIAQNLSSMFNVTFRASYNTATITFNANAVFYLEADEANGTVSIIGLRYYH